jgi:hypothetical protein
MNAFNTMKGWIFLYQKGTGHLDLHLRDNVENYSRECAENVLQQTFTDFE